MSPVKRPTVLAAALVALIAACGAPDSGGDDADNKSGAVPEKPASAVTLNVMDVAGNLQLTQGMIDEFVEKHSDIVSKVNYTKATSPELVGKVKAQQDANRVDIDLVLTGVDGLAAGKEQGLW